MMEPVMIPAGLMCMAFAMYVGMTGAFSLALRRRGKRAATPAPAFLPAVTVIIAARNEEANIRRILEEMNSQDYPRPQFEVILSDDRSDDSTLELARSYAIAHPGLNLTILAPGPSDRNTGKKRAVERAMALAAGEIILMTDADTGRGQQWISSMVAPFGDPRRQMVLGPVMPDPSHNLLQKMQAIEFMGIMGVTAGSAELGFPVMCNGASLACRRSAFVDTGGFSEHLRFASGDDQFLMAAIRKRYGREAVFFNPDRAAIVSTEPERTLSGFIHQRMRWVSKSRGYRDPAVIVTGLVTGLLPLMILGSLVAGFFLPVYVYTAVFILAGKWVVDLMVVVPMIRFFGKRDLWRYYLPAQAFQLFYVILVGIPGLFLPYRWKGRNSRR